MKTILFR